MKKIFILFFFLLLAGVGRAFAEGNEELILKALEKKGICLNNWDSVPGTSSEKALAILMEGEWIPLQDSTIEKCVVNTIGTRCTDVFRIKTSIRYDRGKGFESHSLNIHKERVDDIQNTAFGLILILLLYGFLSFLLKVWGKREESGAFISIALLIGSFLSAGIFSMNIYLGVLSIIMILGSIILSLKG